MSDSFIRLPSDGSGKRIRTKSKTVNSNTVHEEVNINLSSILTQKMENGDNGPIYIGEAEPGSATDESKWRIKKITYSGGLVTDVKWADGNTKFDNIWDNRASYSYS